MAFNHGWGLNHPMLKGAFDDPNDPNMMKFDRNVERSLDNFGQNIDRISIS